MEVNVKKEYHRNEKCTIKMETYELKEEHFVGYYAVIPAKILNDNRLTDKAKILYGHIAAMANQKGYCWATNNYLSKILKCSKETISRAISKLDEYKYLRSEMIREGKLITERRLHIDDNVMGYSHYDQEPIVKNVNTPIVKNVKENITYINNTINNTINKRGAKAPASDDNKLIVYGEMKNVMLTESAYNELIKEYGFNITNKYINSLSLYEKIGKYTNHNLTIRKWIHKDDVPKINNVIDAESPLYVAGVSNG